MRLRTIIAAFAASLITLSTAQAANQIDIRLFPRALDTESNNIYVDIEVRTTDNSKLILAGQNYRIFYDTKMLKLDIDQSISKLPSEKYTDLNLLEKFENVDARNIGDLDFDKNLGFANFSVELKDNLNGGVVLNRKDGWTTVATLKFKMLHENGDYSIVWGREGRSTEYATAFVEMAEWIEPLKTTDLEIQEYIDLEYSRNPATNQISELGELVIGPNPATDFLRISLSDEMTEAGQLYIKDMAGRMAKKISVEQGIRVIQVDLEDLAPASYIIELHSDLIGRHFTEQIVVAE